MEWVSKSDVQPRIPPSTGAQEGKHTFHGPINSHYVSYEGGAKAPKVKTAVKVLGGVGGLGGLYYVIKPLGSFYLMMMKRLLCYEKRIGGGEKWLKT